MFKTMKRPLAMFMTIMMIFSTFMVYLPAYAVEEGPPTTYDIFVGDQIMNQIKADHDASHVMLPGQLQALQNDEAWLTGCYWSWSGVWVKVTGLENWEEITYDTVAKSITGTSDLPDGSYTLILVDDDLNRIRNITLNVSINQPPIPVNDDETSLGIDVQEDDPEITLDVLYNDDDTDGPYIIITGLANSSEGFSFDANQLKYLPPENFNGTASTQYIVSDGTSLARATVTLEVDPVDDLPVAVDDDYGVAMNGSRTVSPLENDYDVDGDAFVIKVLGTVEASEGTVEMHENDTVTFTPAVGYVGTVDVSYAIGYAESGILDEATIHFNVLADEIANELVNDTASTTVDTPVQFSILTNDTLNAGVQLVTLDAATNGVATLTADNKVSYTPNPGFVGTDVFDYTVKDNQNNEESATITVTVSAVDQPVVALDDTVITGMNDIVSVDVVYNDLVPDGVLGAVVTINAQNGFAWFYDDLLHYIPNPFFTGIDTVEYKVMDSDEDYDTAVLTIDVRNEDESSYWLRSDRMWLNEGETKTINVLKNDFIFDMSLVKSVSIYKQPFKGNATIDDAGNLTYFADATYDSEGWAPAVMVGYKVEFESGNVGYGHVKININEVDKILLGDDVRSVLEDSEDNFLPVLDNDIILAGVKTFDIFNMSITDGPHHGSVYVDSGKLYYTPEDGYNGTDTFRYYVVDKDGWLDVASVIVTVVSQPDIYEIEEVINLDTLRDQPITFNPLEMIKEEFGPVTSADFTVPAFGTITYDASGDVTFDPGNQDRQVVTFDFSLFNDLGDEIRGTVAIDVGLLSDEIAIYLYPFTTINPYNQDEYTDFFFQQGDTIDFRQHLDYGLVGTDYPANQINEEAVEIFMIANKGYVADGESVIEAMNMDPLVLENVQSYGQLMIVYNAGDPQGHTGRSVTRLLTINHQPQISTGPITPDDPFYEATVLPEYDEEVFYHDMAFNLLEFAYLYDFEDYNLNPSSPVVTVPAGMDINFVVDGQEYDLSEIWDVLKVPADEDPDVTYKIFDIQFKAYDNDGGVSELSEVFKLKVKNNPPYFKFDGEKQVDGAVLPMSEDLYTTVGIVINLWDKVTAHDLEQETDGLPIYTSLEWRIGSDDYSSDPFPYTAGYYDLKYVVEDAHGETAELFRNIEVNTIPTIDNDGDDPLIRQVNDTLDAWEDIVWADSDPEDSGYMTEGFTPTKQWNFETDMWEDFSGPIDMSVHGRYMMKYTITDPWDEFDEIDRELWVNEPPWIELEDELLLLEERSPEADEIFTAMDGLTYGDFEDEYLELEDYPVLDYTIHVWAMEMDGPGYPPSTVEMIDTTRSGIYMINYTVEDSMGGQDTISRMVMITEAPVVNLDPESLAIEVDGMFPVWNGLEVHFWSPDELVEPDGFGGLPYPQFSFRAYLGNPEEGIELFDLYQFDEAGTYEINYVATVRVEDSNELSLSDVQETMYFTSETISTRTVEVTSEPMGDVVYTSDFLPFRKYMRPGSIEEQMDPEPEDGWVNLYESYDIYPVLMKYNPETNEERLVTAIAFNAMESVMNDEVRFDPNFGFDDIAVLNNGDIYGLIFNEVWLIEPDGTLTYKFNIYQEVMDRVGGEIYFPEFNFQSITVDAEDNLVVASPINPMVPNETEEWDPELVLLYFDPDGRVDEAPVEANIEYGETYYWIGSGLVNYPSEQSMEPFDSITDIAFSSDFEMLYGIGGHYEDQYYDGPVKEPISVESLNSMRTENYYRLFSLVEVEMPIDPLSEESFEEEFFIKYFDLNSQQNLDYGYRYKGIATLEDDIFVTRYNSPRLVVDLDETLVEEEIEFFQTDILRYQFGEENFVFQEDLDPIDGMFMGALGAGSTFHKSWSITPAIEYLEVGYNRTAADGIAQFEANFIPDAAFDEELTWSIASGEDYVTNDGNGQFTVIEANVGGSATATIAAQRVNKATGIAETAYGTIRIQRFYAPTPPTPTPTPTPTQVITVTLDTDAITLDYGETADPEFTSYDFTETVTGTTNTAVTWSLDDDTFVTVDENGVVTAKEDVPQGTGDITVELTVTTVDGGATDTATILFEEQTPLGAIEFFEPYVTGYPDNTFMPKNYVTRAEVAVMFSKILNLNTDFPGLQKFNDVGTDHWAYAYVQAMQRAGIFSGYLDANGVRTFNPEAPISRAEIAQVFTSYWKFLDISVNGENMTTIPDVPNTYWASSAINRIYNTGIFTGYENGNFRPEEPTLREQIVSMINRLIARPMNETGLGKFSDVKSDHPFFGDIEAASETFLKPQGD